MTRANFIIGLIIGALIIGACSGRKKERDGPLAVQEAQLGPVTKDLIKDLPEGLVGDTANARHSNQPLRGEDEDDGN